MLSDSKPKDKSKKDKIIMKFSKEMEQKEQTILNGTFFIDFC